MKNLLIISLFVSISFAVEIRLRNNCPFTVWPGILGNTGKGQPDGGGFELGQGQTRAVNVANDWAGRVWGRTRCDRSGRCETGDCGGKVQCNGAGGVPPATLAEMKFGGLDFYDISLVDGYNLPLKMVPEGGCQSSGCHSDLNARCPNELAVKNSAGFTVACKSACAKFNTDQYCCRGAYGTPQTCDPKRWPVNYAAIFKSTCPQAYSYAYDDQTSTFTCAPKSVYHVTFCP